MRRVLVVILALAILAIGVGIFVYSVGWLAPTAAASTTTLSRSTNTDSTVGSITAPSTDNVGAPDSALGSDAEGETATYTQQGHDGLCDHDQSASAGY